MGTRKGEPIVENGEGLIGDEVILPGVACRSSRLIRDARSLVAASSIDKTPVEQ